MTKILKKMTALLLAGIMTMALLTACGGGSTSFSKQVEDTMLKRVNEGYGTSLNNDSTLYAMAAAALDKVTDDGKIAAKDSIAISVSASSSGMKSTMMVAGDISKISGISKGDALIDAIKITPEDLNRVKNTAIDKVNVPSGAKIEAIAIAAKTKANGNTYVAMAVTYSTSTTNT